MRAQVPAILLLGLFLAAELDQRCGVSPARSAIGLAHQILGVARRRGFPVFGSGELACEQLELPRFGDALSDVAGQDLAAAGADGSLRETQRPFKR
jgi:hypothetical protein